MTTFRDNNVCITFRWLDELHVHRPHRRDVLFDYGLHRPTTLGNIAAKSPDKSNVVGSIYEYFDVQLFKQTRVSKNQDTFHDHFGFWLDAACLVHSSVRLEIAERQVNRFTCLEFSNVMNQQLVIESVRVIKISDLAIVEREVLDVTVVRVLLNEDHFAGTNRFQNAVSHCSLARSGASAYANYHAGASEPSGVAKNRNKILAAD